MSFYFYEKRSISNGKIKRENFEKLMIKKMQNIKKER